MDLLLLFVLSGVALAWGKRVYSRAMGMRRTTKHLLGDRVALSALWFVFPVRLIAESTTCALYGGGGFLTGAVGAWMAEHVSTLALMNLESAAWWAYSACLGIFFVALPFSRYMHIFTEIPLIFLRHYELRSTEKEGSFDHFRSKHVRAAVSASIPVSCRACWESMTCSRSISCATAVTGCCGWRRPTTA